MINEQDVFDTLINGSEESWFEPTERKPQSMIEEGKHQAKLVDLNVKYDKEIQGKFLADIYEPVFEIGSNEVRHKGLFRFKKPDPSLYPHLQADMGSNAGYYAFLKLCGLEQEKDGKIILPPLDLDMVKGLQFEVDVVVENWVGRDGNKMSTPRVARVLQKLSTKNLTEEELPF